MKKKLFTTLFLSCAFITISAQIIHVPTDQLTIQAGINAASTGDTVLVAEGTYYENIRFMGKAITVGSQYIIDDSTSHISNTIIDGSPAKDPDSAATVMFVNNEDTTSILIGFTITGGTGVYDSTWQGKFGGGIYCGGTGAKILNNKIIENHITHEARAGGAGVGCMRETENYWIVIRNNIIGHNTSSVTSLSISFTYGGGIYSSSSAIISNNIIEYNVCENTGTMSDAYGGGIEIEHLLGSNPATVAEITNNTICHNTIESFNSYGAGIRVFYASVSIINNTILNNSVVAINNGNGGGIYIRNALNDIQVVNNDISNNTITAGNYGRGGGIIFWNPAAELIVTGNKINNNITDAVQCRGSGVLFRNPTGRISILNNEFTGNIGQLNADNCQGGGVSLNNAYDTLVIFDGNRFEGNTAILGGGLYSRRSYNLRVTNNIFTNNTSVNGGGLRLRHFASDKTIPLHPQIANNTFYNNYSDYGGAIFLSCEINVPVIFNNIFRENQSPNYKDIYYHDSGTDTVNVSYCNIDEAEIYGHWTGKGNINEDPLFADTTNGDFHIPCSSPCWNAGADSVGIDNSWYYCPLYDLDGNPRPDTFYFIPDMGAYEYPDTCINPGIIDFNHVKNASIGIYIYPNPANGMMNIEYRISNVEVVGLSVFDIHGKEITTLVNETQAAGEYAVRFDASGLPAGLYLLRLQAGQQVASGKIIKMK